MDIASQAGNKKPTKGRDSPAMMRSSHMTHTERTRVLMEIHKDTNCIYLHTKARVVE